MKINILLFVIFLPFIACNQSEDSTAPQKTIFLEKLKGEIDKLEAKLLIAEDAKKDKETAIQLIEKSKNYVKEFPKDSASAEILFKAADVARGLGEYGKAIQMWGEVWRDYQDYENAPQALFLQGFTFDADLKDKDLAEQYYKKFLKNYPEHPLAAQVKMLLSVIDKTSEELIKEFKKNQEE